MLKKIFKRGVSAHKAVPRMEPLLISYDAAKNQAEVAPATSWHSAPPFQPELGGPFVRVGRQLVRIKKKGDGVWVVCHGSRRLRHEFMVEPYQVYEFNCNFHSAPRS
jgi:hypothetical protein